MLKKFIIKTFFFFKNKIFDYFYLFNLNFIKFNSFIKKNSYHIEKENNSIFLFDSFEVLENTCFRLLYLPIISKFYKSRLFYFNANSIIFKKLYNSINANKLNIRLNKSQIAERDLKIKNFFKSIQSREDLLNYSISKLNIGLDIYESYLIRYKKPTIENINIKNKNLKKVAEEAFSLLNWIIAFALSYLISPFLSQKLNPFFDSKLTLDVSTRIFIFTISFITFLLLTSSFTNDLTESINTYLNRFLGLCFGCLKYPI
jgi:hypothetical protein